MEVKLQHQRMLLSTLVHKNAAQQFELTRQLARQVKATL